MDKILDVLYSATLPLDAHELDPSQPALRHISLQNKSPGGKPQSFYCCQGGNIGIICSSFPGSKREGLQEVAAPAPKGGTHGILCRVILVDMQT